MKRFFVFLLFLTVFSTLSAWDEFNRYSIADELRKPGVKLVAVDFYATWCEPCNEAIPKWKKLQEKYGDKGFKLIVVSVQSDGSCSQPPQWNPDKIVCDYDGDIANAWHANNLPQAFLWSWQGNLLVAHGGVDSVASAIEQYFKNIPRVYVEEGNDEDIYKMVRSELIKNSKIEVVASDEERAALAELRKKSANLNYDQKLQCKLGEEVSANSRLVISQQKRGKKETLVLELFSVEKGCLTASGTATMRGNPETEVAEAVYNLLKNLLGEVTMPSEGGKPAKAQKPAAQNSNFQDSVACEYARSEAKDFAWKAYLKNYPKGECATEAKDELDKAACRKAEQSNSESAWKEYLKEYPDGKCAAKAKDEFDKTACRNAEKKNTVNSWEEYLKEYPNGKCSVQARTAIQKFEAVQAEKTEKIEKSEAVEEFETVENFEETAERETIRPYKTAGISLLVTGAVVGALGGVSFYGMQKAEKDRKKYRDLYLSSSTQEDFEKYRKKSKDADKQRKTYTILGGVGLGVGGALIVTGVVLMVIKKDNPYDGEFALSNFSIAPANDGFYASIGFEF